MLDTGPPPGGNQLCVTLHIENRPPSSRILDIARAYPPLAKELAYRAVAADPGTAGLRWRASIRMETGESSVVLQAKRMDGNRTLATMKIPADTFAWIAANLAADAGVEGGFEYSITASLADEPVAGKGNVGDEDFEIITDPGPDLKLPRGFRGGTPVPQGRPIQAVPRAWLVCVFRDKALRTFLQAASKECNRERSWAGMGFVHVSPGACRTVIEEIIEIPGEAGQTWIITPGRDWAAIHERIGADRLVAYLHLHPRMVGDRNVLPKPSAHDAIVAWDVDLTSRNPCVFPIALFGADPAAPNGDLAVFGYVDGLLQRIPVEVAV